MSSVMSFKPTRDSWAVLLDKTNIQFSTDAPNPEYVMVEANQSNLSQTSCNVQFMGLNHFTSGEVLMEYDIEVITSGKTVDPNGVVGTVPYVNGKDNSTFDAFCLNKSISNVKINDGSITVEDTDRKNPEYLNICAMQYDTDYLNKNWGIHLLEDVDAISYANVVGYGATNVADVCAGIGALVSDVDGTTTTQKRWIIDRNEKYSVPQPATFAINGTNFSIDSNPPTVVSSNTYFGSYCPISYTGGGEKQYAYCQDTELATQTQVWKIREYLICPQTSTPYSPNTAPKVFRTVNGQLNFSFEFNTRYIQSMFKMGNLISLVQTVNSIKIKNVKLRVATFKTFPFRNLPNSSAYVHFKPMAINDQLQVLVDTGAPGDFNVTPNPTQFRSQNEPYMPPYFIIYGCLNPADNSSITGGKLWDMTDRMCDLEEIKMIINGDQRNVLEGKTIDDLKRDTARILKDERWYDYLSGKSLDRQVLQIPPIQGAVSANPTPLEIQAWIGNIAQSLGGGNTAFSLQSNTQGHIRYRDYPFIIIDTSKLNLGYVSGRPLVPYVDYGIKLSWKIDVKWKPLVAKNQYTGEYTIDTQQMNCRCLYLQKYFTKISDGLVQPTEVWFNVNEFDLAYNEFINSRGHTVNTDTMMGSGWFDTLESAVKSGVNVLKDVAKVGLPIANTFSHMLPPQAQAGLNFANQYKSVVGLGKRKSSKIAWN
jgi:hypothetical protein